jgi:tetratricopeptide (TPR) repeat protein
MIQAAPPTRRLARRRATLGDILFIAILAFSFRTPSIGGQAPTGPSRAFPGNSESYQIGEVRRLEVGVVVRRELSKGESHEYILTLEPDEFARITLQQRHTDLVLEVSGNEDQGVLEVDGANGSAGQEVISILGGVNRDYRLRVRRRGQDTETGGYELMLTERRAATPADRQGVAAERLFLAAKRQRREGRTSDLVMQRVAKFDDARRIWHELNDQRGEAGALLNRGMEYHVLNMLPAALESYVEALQIYSELGLRLDQAVALRALGITKLRLADRGSALESFERALQLFQAEDDQKNVGAMLYQIGRTYYLSGDLVQSLRFYEEALPIRRRFNDRVGEAYVLMGIGRVHANGFGNYDQAFDFFEQALKLVPSGPAFAEVQGDLGRLHFFKHEYEIAHEHYQKALAEIGEDEDKTQDKAILAELTMYHGMLYAAQGDHQTALVRFNKALRLQRSVDDQIGEGHTLKNMGLSNFAVKDNTQALGHLHQALEIWLRVMYRTAEADTRYELASVESRLGNLPEARRQIEAAFPIVESLRSRIANQHLRISYFASAQKFYELYIDVLMRQYAQTGDRSLQALALSFSERARTRSMLDTIIEARAEVHSGAKVADLEKESALQRKLTLLSQRQMIDPRQSESQQVKIRQDLAALVVEYHALEARIRESSPRYAGLTHPEPLSLEAIQRLLDSDQMLLEYAFGEERSYLWAVTRESIKSYELPKRREIEAASATARSLLIKRNPEYLRSAGALSKMLLGRVEFLNNSSRLLIVSSGSLQYLPFASLPVPVRGTQPALESTPDGKLDTVPLLVYHEIETPPSVSVLAELRRERAEPDKSVKRKQVLVIADPVFGIDDDRFSRNFARGRREGPRTNGNPPGAAEASPNPKVSEFLTRAFNGRVPRLIFTRREADAILSVMAPAISGEKVLDFAANRDFVTTHGTLSNYRIVHFATHGMINDEYPELSGILLSLFDEQRRPREGLLQMHEIYNLSIPADIVVLSGCETSIGREMKGEGLQGLSRAFIYAGARRVVASLWKVGDDSTAELMGAFYRNLFHQRGVRPAAALREAQLELWKKAPSDSPHRWAAFITYGDSRF